MNHPVIQTRKDGGILADLAGVFLAAFVLLWRAGLTFGFFAFVMASGWLLWRCYSALPDHLLAGCLLTLAALAVVCAWFCAALLNASLERGDA